MPFSVGEAINSFANWMITAPLTSGIFKNPVYTALALSVIIVVIIMIVFRNVETEETDPLWKLGLRIGMYVLAVSISFIFFHSYYLKHELAESTGGEELSAIFNAGNTMPPEEKIAVGPTKSADGSVRSAPPAAQSTVQSAPAQSAPAQSAELKPAVIKVD